MSKAMQKVVGKYNKEGSVRNQGKTNQSDFDSDAQDVRSDGSPERKSREARHHRKGKHGKDKKHKDGKHGLGKRMHSPGKGKRKHHDKKERKGKTHHEKRKAD